MNLHDAAQNRNAAKGVLTQENIGFGLTILPPSAFKKPGNPNRITGLFSRYYSPKIAGPALGGKKHCRHRFANGQFAQKFQRNFCCHGQPQNCFAPLKQKLGLQSKEKRRRHPLWLSRRFDNTMRPNFCFRGNVFLRQRAFCAGAVCLFCFTWRTPRFHTPVLGFCFVCVACVLPVPSAGAALLATGVR